MSPMAQAPVRFECSCGFRCYSTDQEWYHRAGICRTLRRILGVIAARERQGLRTHDGVQIGGFVLRQMAVESDGSRPRQP